jgi:hypothetical protein
MAKSKEVCAAGAQWLACLRRGQLKIKGRPSPLENLNAELQMENGLMSVKALSGTLGQGPSKHRALGHSSHCSRQHLRIGVPTPSAQFSVQAEDCVVLGSCHSREDQRLLQREHHGRNKQFNLKALNARAQFGELLVKSRRNMS